jgi:hypothetical protein
MGNWLENKEKTWGLRVLAVSKDSPGEESSNYD